MMIITHEKIISVFLCVLGIWPNISRNLAILWKVRWTSGDGQILHWLCPLLAVAVQNVADPTTTQY
jgi:hypothetical protein